uniref:Transmembrane protein 177 n=1 Tax=Glossina brevipalpis TaxID=37001 RepID=A0A1A9WQF2_9MUSC
MCYPKNKIKKSKFGYFTTTSGKKVTFFLAGTATIGLVLVNFVPHTVGLNYYKDFIQCYRNGEPLPISEKVAKRFSRAKDMLNIKKTVYPVETFSVFGFDLFNAGYTKSRFGIKIGVPVNYDYDSIDSVKWNEITYKNKEINWDSENGKLLKQSIVLTEAEQTFGFCKALLQAQTNSVILNSIFPAITFLAMYTFGRYLNLSQGLLSRPFGLRMVMYTILGSFGYGSWSFMKDYTQVTSDAEIDKKLSSLGSEFVTAGISFYDKQLKKNIALRELMGDDTYTAKGNVNYLLRQKSLPLTIRKSYFEEMCKKENEGLINN